MRTTSLWGAFLTLALVAGCSCGDSSLPPPGDGGTTDGPSIDGARDGAVDGARDARTDAPPDAGACPPETCNGEDDDCDGAVDEDAVEACGTDVGACVAGTAACVAGAPGACVGSVDPLPEVCNGQDDNCDGTIDEACPCAPDGVMQGCGSGTGECVMGVQTCATGSWGACVGEVGSSTELCNALDDDCDGVDDDGFLVGGPCDGPDTDVCNEGVAVCSADGLSVVCDDTTGDIVEACNTMDDDCDAAVDEGCTCTDGTTQPCGTDVGECTAGMQTCAGGAWGLCTGDVPPGVELCNTLDDDCDGSSDEDYTLGGGCDGPDSDNCVEGIVACDALMRSVTCSDATADTVEACNGTDDDCDSSTDEGFGTLSCGVGSCAASVMACLAGAPQTCMPGTPAAETCNSLDDDCNGMTDDGLGSTTCGLGVCQATVMNCIGGAPQTCTAGTPGTETCNALDDDCNGTADDGLGSTTCGVGGCRVTQSNCVGGAMVACMPGPAGAETCNGIDDDCDSLTDETALGSGACYTGPASTRGVGACRDGSQTCSAGGIGPCVGELGPSAEACNGADDDCNGMVDDGLGIATCGIGACSRMAPACSGGLPGVCLPGAPAAEICGNGIDDNCNGVVDDGCGCTHVSPTGNDATGTGAASAPFLTIVRGIAAAGTMGLPMTVCVASGVACPSTANFDEIVVMRDGVTVLGGYRASGAVWARVAGCTTVIRDQDGRGVYFGPSVTAPTAIDGFTVNGLNLATNAGVTVEGSTGAVVSNDIVSGGAGTTSRGVDVIDSGGVAATPLITGNQINGGTGTSLSIGIRSLRSAPVIRGNCNMIDPVTGRCASPCGGTRFIRGFSGAAGATTLESYGVRLETSPNAEVDSSSLCVGAGTVAVASVRITGDASGVVVRANNMIAFGNASDVVGLWADPCAGASPWIVNNQQISGGSNLVGGKANGVRAIGDCHPIVDSNFLIFGGIESANSDTAGVHCMLDATSLIASRCVVVGNATIRGGGGGFPPTSVGVRCDDGACARIERNVAITGSTGIRSIGIRLGRTGTLVARNGIQAGCGIMEGTGVYTFDSFARLENNVITGNVCGAGAAGGSSWGVRIQLAPSLNEVEVHSNDIFGGGTPGAPCTSRGIAIEAGPALPTAPSGIIRNNIVYSGSCGTARYDLEETSVGTDPRIFQNNDLWYGAVVATALYRDEAATNLLAVGPVNALSDITSSGNLSVDPMLNASNHIPALSMCVDTGIATGAPVIDFDAETRPFGAASDIGADEYHP